MSAPSFSKKTPAPLRQTPPVTVSGSEEPGDPFELVKTWSMRAAWIGGIFLLALLVWASSGQTLTAAENCRAHVQRLGYRQNDIDWTAPVKYREQRQLENYMVRKSYESRLQNCDAAQGEPIVTCGLLKCGGVFSLATESTANRKIREDIARRVEEARTSHARREQSRQEEEAAAAAREQKQALERQRVERILQQEAAGNGDGLRGNRMPR